MTSLLKLKSYIGPFWAYILASALLAIPLSAIRVGPAPVVKYMLDDLIIRKDLSKLWILPTALIGLYVLNFIVRFLHYFLLRVVIFRVNQRVRNDLFRHLLGLSADYFTEQSTGTLISRTSSDPQYIDQGLSCINIIIREPITLLFLFGYAINLNWRLTLMTLIAAPLLAWLFSATGRNLKRYITRITETNAELFSTLQESFSGIRIVKSFSLEKYLHKQFREKNERYAKLFMKTALLEEAAHPMVELLTALALAPIVYYGGREVIQSQMTAGDLFAFFTTFALMMNPIRMMNDVNMKIHQASAAADRIFELFNWKSRLHEAKNPVKMPSPIQSLEWKNVSFSYPDAPERTVLDQVSFTVPAGKVAAIIGSSGAGKSSLVSLFPRIFDVTGGQILVNGIDIRNIKVSNLRKSISIVSQDIFLFNDTIEENIRCGKLTASKSEIEEAARQAHCLEFIDRLPNKMDTIIGDRGTKLSGGERQRLSIARAILRKTPFLILDEATSNLDTESERIVKEALDRLMVGKTTLMIAHRLSTIQHADLILVLKNGKIIEQGSHTDLLKNASSEYAKFHKMGEVQDPLLQ